MGFQSSCCRSPVLRHASSYVNHLVTTVVILAWAWKAVTGLAANEDQADEALRERQSESNALLFAEPLHGDGITFVAAQLKAALSSGTPSLDMVTIAAEAASLISWSECSRFCSGGTQTADTERAIKLAVEGLRRVFSDSGEWSDSHVDEVEKKVTQFTMDGDAETGQAKTRPCNTFSCPFEVPTDLKTANLQIAREPALVASFGVVPQVEFNESCRERLMLDRIDQEIWTARRADHLHYRKMQDREGNGQGWEATVLAPEQLNLYSCVTLCRLHHKCSALIYAEDIVPMQSEEGESANEDLEGDALNVLESIIGSAGSAVKSLDENLAELSTVDSNSLRLNSQNGNPVCTLYTGVRVSRIAECGTEPTKRAGRDTLTLLVTNLDIAFADVARVMLASMAQELDRVKNVLNDARLLVNQTSIRNWKPANVQQRAERLVGRLIKARNSAQLVSHIIPEAVRVMEDAAVAAAHALRASQSEGDFAVQISRVVGDEDKSSSKPKDGLRQAFYSLAPQSPSCPVFSGVELLNRGCVQLPALQTHGSGLGSASSLDATERQHISGEASLMTWQKCQDVLNDVLQLVNKYRKAVSQIKESGEDATNAEKEANRLLTLVLGLSAEERAKLSSPDISDRLKAETGLMNKDFAQFLDDKDAIELRREVVQRLGEGTGTLFSVYNMAKQVCEIRAVFEPRHAEAGDTLGAQFPSACASFSPFSLVFLPSKSSGSGSTSLELGELKSEVGTCEDTTCKYSPWTSWSPCDDSYQLEADTSDEGRNNLQLEMDGVGRHTPAMWQVRVKETLMRPNVTTRCDAIIETRLCKDRVTAESEASGLMTRCDKTSLEVQNVCEAVPKCSSENVEDDRIDAVGGHLGLDRESQTVSSAIHLHSHATMMDTEALASGRMLFSSLTKMPRPSISLGTGPVKYMEEAQQESGDNSHALPLGDVPERFVTEHYAEDLSAYGTIGQHLDKPAVDSLTENEPLSTAEDSTVAVEEGSQNPESGLSPAVAASTDDGGTSNSAFEGSTSMASYAEYGDTQALKVEGDSAAAPSTEDDNTHALSGGTQPLGEPVTIPYDSPFIEDTKNHVHEGTALVPPSEKGANGSIELAGTQDEPVAAPHDSHLSENTSITLPGTNNNFSGESENASANSKPALEGRVETTQQASEGDTAAPESFFLGLSCFSFVGCCLFGALASTVLVLITVVCSRRIRSWLGYDWSGATDEERLALLKNTADSSRGATIPLVNPDGINVLRPDGAPLVVSPCLNRSGGQYVTPDGSKIFTTVEGDFVNSWGERVQASELPKELIATVGPAQPKESVPSQPFAETVKGKGAPNGISARSAGPPKLFGEQQPAATAQSKAMPFVAPPAKMVPEPKQVPGVPGTSAMNYANAKMPGLPTPKAPGTG
ncbi:hypothetical protein, conserved [Eimeria maxima]|uniref:Transmembrane protein n=1 Tax=Eimeria maxima TaxID=5804 RepID=U6M7R8_EIMMA|nr:hypothetical protein, conserved [Eimeria maxima]CDJ60056.1 hypothetical protein, conserved [Eimeria maxima]